MGRIWRKGGLAAILVALLFVIGCTESELGTEFVEISEEESGIVFYGPGLKDGQRRFLSGKTDQFVRQTSAAYSPPSGAVPFASIILIELPPTRHFAQVSSPEEDIRYFDLFAGMKVTVDRTGSTANAIGRVEYSLFTADNYSCVNWKQNPGSGGGPGYGRYLLLGYYCRYRSIPLDTGEAEKIVKAIGHRELGMPASAPAERWGKIVDDSVPAVRLVAVWGADKPAGRKHFSGTVRLVHEAQRLSLVSADGHSCAGMLRPEGADASTRLWTLSCTDGRSAEGTLKLPSATVKASKSDSGSVYGVGIDTEGRSVIIRAE